jgi:hypothetical protein
VPAELERGRTEIEQRAGDVRRVAELPQQYEALLEEFLGSRVLANGEREIAEVVDRGPLDRDLTLVQYSVGDGGSLKWWTSTDEGNLARTTDDVQHCLALLPEWGQRETVCVARIPQGTDVEYLYGRAGPQVQAGVVYAGQGEQFRLRSFDERWIRETRRLP